jgi:hypothetical protein
MVREQMPERASQKLDSVSWGSPSLTNLERVPDRVVVAGCDC